MNTLIITQTGIAEASLASSQGLKVVLSSFKLGDSFGYTPTGAEATLHGSIVYSAPITAFSNLPDGTLVVDLTMDLDSNLGFGEIGIYTNSGKLFAIGALPVLLQKSGIAGDLAATYTFRCLLKLSQLNASFVVSTTGFDVAVPAVFYCTHWSQVLPPASMSNPDIKTIVVADTDEKGSYTTLVQTETGWSIQGNYFSMDASVALLASTGTYCEISTADWQAMVPDTLATSMAEAQNHSFVIETSSNRFREAVPSIVNSRVRFTYNENLDVIPSTSTRIGVWVNDSLKLYEATTSALRQRVSDIMTDVIPVGRRTNLEPEAGFGTENTVPVSSAYPNALNHSGPSLAHWMDSEGQRVVFFTSKTAYGTRKLARARVLSTVIVDDGNPTVGGEQVVQILNGSRMSMNVVTVSGRNLVAYTASSSDATQWTVVADVTTIAASTPSGAASLLMSSFHYAPEFNKIIRMVYTSSLDIWIQIISVGSSPTVLASLSIYSLANHLDFTGGQDLGSVAGVLRSVYQPQLSFAYSYTRKEIVTGFTTWSYMNGIENGRELRFLFDFPDAVFSGNFTGVNSHYSTYSYYNNLGAANNGFRSNASGITLDFSWDSFTSSYAMGAISYWPNDLGWVNWSISDMATHDVNAGAGTPLPDATYIGKVIYSNGLIIGNSSAYAAALSDSHGYTPVNIPFSGTVTLETHKNYKTSVASITPLASRADPYYDETSGYWYSCSGPNATVMRATEAGGTWSFASISKTAPAFPSGYTPVSSLLYISTGDIYVAMATKTGDTLNYVYLIAYTSATTYTVIDSKQNHAQIEGTHTDSNYMAQVYRVALGLVDQHLFVGLSYTTPGGAYGLSIFAYAKASILSLTPTSNVITNQVTYYYPYYGGLTVGKTPAGLFYIAQTQDDSPPGYVRLNFWASSSAFVSSTFNGGSTAPSDTIDLSVYTTSGLWLYVNSYPLFLGGYQCNTPASLLTLSPNKTTYVVATKDSADKETVDISVIDYLPSGNASIFNSFNQVCLVECTTDGEKITNKIDYSTRRDAQQLSVNGTTLSISRGNSVTIADGATGQIAFFAGSTSPLGWIKANGAAISRTSYASLFARIGTTYGGGDGSTTFNLPDMRGYFPRALSDGSSVDSGRALGSTQTDQSVTLQDGGYTVYDAPYNAPGYLASPENGAEGHAVVYRILGSARLVSGYDTRPVNIALLACIKY